MSDAVRYDVDGAVATITLNRPDAMNAFDLGMKEALPEVLKSAAQDVAVRAVVLTGAGRGFCVGQDLKEHADLLAANDPRPLRTVTDHFNPIVTLLASMPKPVVAAVNGPAAGAGASLAFACDFRVAAETAKFSMAFTAIGLVPDSGASWTLQRLVGYPRAMQMLLSPEPVPAAQALEWGLVTTVVATDECLGAAQGLAAALASGPTRAYALTKKALIAAATSDLPAALELEAELQAQAGQTRDHINAVQSFVNKQRPVFEGR
ncbi:MAG TPA: enoyl-CoA hydratase-related protein [Mycobacteriales bacterium]|nr:enoyl-CoA hydratase-related protein [Mycobacteriales bacterium]